LQSQFSKAACAEVFAAGGFSLVCLSFKKKKEWVCKPSSVPHRKDEMAVICLDLPLPTGSSDLPAVNTRARCQRLGLAGGGVFPAGIVTDAAVRSCRTISPLLAPIARDVSRVFSVALSRGLPRVAVSHHRALSCSDFPPRTYLSQSLHK